jgi:hypothetical protein
VPAPFVFEIPAGTFYELTIITSFGGVEGGGWHRKGSTATWTLLPPLSQPMPFPFGVLGGSIRPERAVGSVVMERPTMVEVVWQSDLRIPAVLLGLFALLSLVHPTEPFSWNKHRLWASATGGEAPDRTSRSS